RARPRRDRVRPLRRLPRGGRVAGARRSTAPPDARAVRRPPQPRQVAGQPVPAKKLILIVIDGLTPSMLEAAVERGDAPALAQLLAIGDYRHAVSTFPSLTPVCLSSIATGAHGDVHEIPHLVWWHRGEQRLVEYGSSFGAVRAAGLTRSLRDTIFDLNRRHLGAEAVTIYEGLEDAGYTAAAINITCYRGRTRHVAILPGLPAAYGPKRFFFYSLFASELTGA